MTLLAHGNRGRLPSPSFELRQFRQLLGAGKLVESLNAAGQMVITCQCCGWDVRRPSRAPSNLRRKATSYDRRRAVWHFLQLHRDRLPDGFRVQP